MGQPITVVAKPSSNPSIIRYETNRAITGMGHERYSDLSDIIDDRPVDELARRVLTHGGVASVHVNSNVITVQLAGGSTGEGLDDVIGGLYLFYPDVVVDAETEPAAEVSVEEPTAVDEPAAEVSVED